MDYLVILLLQIGSAVASLVLMSLGLAVIFGMMRVINLAHGEFLMLGGYAAITAFNLGVNLWVAMVVVAPLMVGLFGAIVERLVIRHLYGRLIDTMLATWGLSLAMIGFVTVVFGNTVSGISAPLGSVSIGAAYIAKAFITVISGGAAILSGTAIASALLGTINTLATFAFTSVLGEVALLVAAVVLLRLLPQGITGRFFRRAL